MAQDDGQQYPWLRREGESPQAYDAFRTYMRMGVDRSTAAVAHELRKTKTIIDRWSGQNDWVKRVSAHDSYLQQAETDGHAEEIAKVRTQHLTLTDELLAHLRRNMQMWAPGHDPSIRWTQAFSAATRAQQMALTLKADTKQEGVLEQILKRVAEIEAGS